MFATVACSQHSRSAEEAVRLVVKATFDDDGSCHRHRRLEHDITTPQSPSNWCKNTSKDTPMVLALLRGMSNHECLQGIPHQGSGNVCLLYSLQKRSF